MAGPKKSWVKQHLNDHYVKQAAQQGYRSRAVFKLKELIDRYQFIQQGDQIVELGSAPGAWTQLLSERKHSVVACDLLPMQPVKNVEFIQGDFLQEDTQLAIRSCLKGRCDIVMSDMAPDLTGSDIIDQVRMHELVSAVLVFCKDNLKENGQLLIKLFNGRDFEAMYSEVKLSFTKVKVIKPDASRQASKEVYLLADKFRL
jgi:23S rRNA (uridine2552-2'-O)-methyltransferase